MLSVLASAALAALLPGARGAAAPQYLGKVIPPALAAGVPQPLAFFPLTEGKGQALSSYPAGNFSGVANTTIPWKSDPVFGSVLRCDKGNHDLIILDPVDYGTKGPFSLNAWVKLANNSDSGELFGYFFSHSRYATKAAPSNQSAFHANQVQLFLPEADHPAHGLVRTIVKDSSASDAQAFTDSDGTFNNNDVRDPPVPAQITPETWHMVTVTTQPDQQLGYRVYVDGKLAVELPLPNVARANATAPLEAGAPLLLGPGTPYLCGRCDADPTRFFSGSVAHVSMFDTALSPAAVQALYATVQSSANTDQILRLLAPSSAEDFLLPPELQALQPYSSPALAPGALKPRLQDAPVYPPAYLAASPGFPQGPAALPPLTAGEQRLTQSGRPCKLPFIYKGQTYNDCVAIPQFGQGLYCLDIDERYGPCNLEKSTEYDAFKRWVDQWAGKGQLQVNATNPGAVVLCGVNGTAVPETGHGTCDQGYVCAPLSWQQIDYDSNATPFGNSIFDDIQVGVCAKPESAYLPIGPSLNVPAAYFPLCNYSLNAWPVPQLWFWNSSQDPSRHVTWVKDDTFGEVIHCNAAKSQSLSVSHVDWGRQGGFAFSFWVNQDSAEGTNFQYLLSTRPKGLGPISDNNIFQPNQVHIYLPTENHPAHGLVRVIVKDGDDNSTGAAGQTWLDSDGRVSVNNDRATPRTNFTGHWHMITLTTHPDESRGYVLYIDGVKHGEVKDGQDFFHVDGGDPLHDKGDIVLCGRSDLAEGRFFDGRIAQLSIWDSGLAEFEVGLLYEAVTGFPPIMPGVIGGTAILGDSNTPALAPGVGAVLGSGSWGLLPAQAILSPASAPLGDSVPLGGVFGRLGQLLQPSAATPGSSPTTAGAPAHHRTTNVPNPAIGPSASYSAGAVAQGQAVSGPRGKSGGALGVGPIVGIVVAIVAVLALAAVVLAVVLRRKGSGRGWQKEELGGGPPGGGFPGIAQPSAPPAGKEAAKGAGGSNPYLSSNQAFEVQAHTAP